MSFRITPVSDNFQASARILVLKGEFNLGILGGEFVTAEKDKEYEVPLDSARSLASRKMVRILAMTQPGGTERQIEADTQPAPQAEETEQAAPADWPSEFRAEFRIRERRRVAVSRFNRLKAAMGGAIFTERTEGEDPATDKVRAQLQDATRAVESLEGPKEVFAARMAASNAMRKINEEVNTLIVDLKKRARATFDAQVQPLADVFVAGAADKLYPGSTVFARFDAPYQENDTGDWRTCIWKGKETTYVDGPIDSLASTYLNRVAHRDEVRAASKELDRISSGVARVLKKLAA